MTTSSMSTSMTTDQPTTATDEGSTTDQAKDQAKHVADVAGQEARQVAADVREQARGLLDETKTQVQDQSRTQRDRLVETLRTFSDDLDAMAREGGGLASDAAREVAQRARSFSQQLDGREPAELLDDLRSFARRRPGIFLAGAVISGVVVGRLLRGARDAGQEGTTGYDAATTSYDPNQAASAEAPAPTDEPLPPPSVRPAGYPPVSPAVTQQSPTAEAGRPLGGP